MVILLQHSILADLVSFLGYFESIGPMKILKPKQKSTLSKNRHDK